MCNVTKEIMTDLFRIQTQAHWNWPNLQSGALPTKLSSASFRVWLSHSSPLKCSSTSKINSWENKWLFVVSKIILKLQCMLTNEQYWSYSETRICVPSFKQDSRIAGLIIQFIKWRTMPARGYTTCPLVRKVRKTIALKGGWNPEKKWFVLTIYEKILLIKMSKNIMRIKYFLT